VAGGFAKLGLNLPSRCRIIQDMYSLYLQIILHLYSLTFSAKMLGEKMKRDNMVSSNDKIKNKLNISEYRILKF
jgi:hypothetical protein